MQVMVALHAMNPEIAKKSRCIGAPTLDYSKELAKGQFYNDHVFSLLQKSLSNRDVLSDRYTSLLTRRKALKDKIKCGNALTPQEKSQLSSCNKQVLKLENKITNYHNLYQEFMAVHREFEARHKLTLNYQKVGSQRLHHLSAQCSKSNADSAQQFLDLCGKVLGQAQEEMKNQSGKKDPTFANYTVRGNFRDFRGDFRGKERKFNTHAIIFYVLTHQDEKGRPFQTAHFRDCNVGDLIARAKNWSSLRDLSQIVLSDKYDRRSKDGKLQKAIEFRGWCTERYEHSVHSVDHLNSSQPPSNLVSRFASLNLPYNMSEGLKVLTRLNTFPPPRGS